MSVSICIMQSKRQKGLTMPGRNSIVEATNVDDSPLLGMLRSDGP